MLQVEIKWVESLLKNYSAKEVKDWVHKWIVKILLFLENKSIPETPIITWTLRKWYYVEAKWMWGKVANETEYWPFVHNWTKNIKANPFLRRVEQKYAWQTGRIMNKEIARNFSIL